MVDVSPKETSARRALACGRVEYSPASYAALRREGSGKGDVLRVAEIAGTMAAKRTAELIPLCHPLSLDQIRVTAEFDDGANAVAVRSEVKATGRTGVEMEALTAVAVACLTVYDMTKAIDKSMRITGVALVEKSGGASGDFQRS